ncbi:MAG: hypothetical protein R3E14_05810 [Erythrobacter sp.]
MIDYFAIGLTHGLILFLCWRLLNRDDLDDPLASPPETRSRRGKRSARKKRETAQADA